MPELCTTLLLAQLRDCSRMDPDWHRAAWGHATQHQDTSELRARLAGRLDAPDDLRAVYAATATSEVRQAFLARADLSDAEVAAAVAVERSARVLTGLAAANRTSTAVLAGLGRAFVAKPTKALALALLDAEPAALPQNVADAVVPYLIGLNGRGLTDPQAQTLKLWSGHLSAQQADEVVASLEGAAFRLRLRFYQHQLAEVPGLSEASRQTLFDTIINSVAKEIGVGAARLKWRQERSLGMAADAVASLVRDLPADHVLADRAACLANSSQLTMVAREVFACRLRSPKPDRPAFFAPACGQTPAPTGPDRPRAVGTEREAEQVVSRLNEAARCTLAAATLNPLLLDALTVHATTTGSVEVAAAALANPSVVDRSAQLLLLEVLTARDVDVPQPVVADLLSRVDDPDVVAAAYLCDPATAVNGCGLGKLTPDQVTKLVIALGAELARSDAGPQMRARLGLSAFAASTDLTAEGAQQLPWPLIRSWAETGLYRWPGYPLNAPAPSGRPLWRVVWKLQQELNCDAAAAATFAGLAATFSGTFGELAATCRSISSQPGTGLAVPGRC